MLNSNDPLQVNTSFQVHRKSFGSISAPLHHTLLLQGQDHDGAYTEGKPVGKTTEPLYGRTRSGHNLWKSFLL